MDPDKKISRDSFRRMLEDAIAEIGEKELLLSLDLLKAYCRLTGHDLERCQEEDRAPAGFFVTFTDPIVSQMFLAFFMKRPKVIKGVIHTGSVVTLSKPVKISSSRYRETLRVAGIEEKSGTKGDYFAVDFEVELKDEQGASVGTDAHQFFLRV